MTKSCTLITLKWQFTKTKISLKGAWRTGKN